VTRIATRSALFLLLAAALAAPARADETSLAGELTPATDRAIEAGLEKLLTLQDETTGQFGKNYTIASTSLAGLAILASGDVWGRGPRAHAVQRAVHFLLNHKSEPQPGRVFFEGLDTQGKMHAHGFAMLFLAEVYGMTNPDMDAQIRETLRGAIQTSLDAQTNLGGWGYFQKGENGWGQDEASVTITQIEALRACRNAGFVVPSDAIKSAIGYVKRSMTSDGSCRYSLTMGEGNRVSYELTAAAVATLNASGVYDSPELARGLSYLRKALEGVDAPGKASSDFYYYGNFYAAQAMFQAGGPDWANFYPAIRRELLEKQKDGGWESQRNFGEAYSTASALLILELPKRYLPIFTQ
jgi:hypothetical protein